MIMMPKKLEHFSHLSLQFKVDRLQIMVVAKKDIQNNH